MQLISIDLEIDCTVGVARRGGGVHTLLGLTHTSGAKVAFGIPVLGSLIGYTS